MTLLAGRGFRATDTADAPRVAIVNDTFARHYWPDGNVIGRRFRIADRAREQRIEVVGVVKTTETFYPGEPAQEIVHFPFRQEPRGTMVLLAETVCMDSSPTRSADGRGSLVFASPSAPATAASWEWCCGKGWHQPAPVSLSGSD